jgi:hypothetical protein
MPWASIDIPLSLGVLNKNITGAHLQGEVEGVNWLWYGRVPRESKGAEFL